MPPMGTKSREVIWGGRIDIADGNTTSAIRLAPIRAHLLVELMTLAATWERFVGNDWVPIDCPQRVAETYLARDGAWNVPVLAGIVNCPVLRPDGSILETAGYDAATGLLYDPQGMKFSPVPEKPDREDALRALTVLKDLLSTFPFVTDADRSRRAVGNSDRGPSPIIAYRPGALFHGAGRGFRQIHDG
jgi:putative DNA primase/helicase